MSILGPRFREFRVLTQVRNPWDRLASAFHFASIKAPGYQTRDKQDAIKIAETFQNDLPRFLTSFAENPEPWIGMLWFRPAVSFIDPARCPVPLHIQKLEEIDNLEPLRTFVGPPDFTVGHERKRPVSPKGPSVYTPALFDAVGQIYARDVETFGYGDYDISRLSY